MSSNAIARVTCIILIFLSLITIGKASVFQVKKFGARANGYTDDSKAIMNAWSKACMSKTPSKVVIPSGKYMVGSLKFQGPCKAPISVQVEGTLLAPANMKMIKSQDSWITFQYINQLSLTGSGTFDGQGSIAWKVSQCASSGKCGALPISLRFTSLNNSVIQDITSTNSKFFHMNVLNSMNVTLKNIHILAPAHSLNTDGIHIGRSSKINITNVNIQTGDDCVSIGDGSQQINIERVRCGPGHGISIGSLGKYENEQPVSGVNVRNCTISNAMFGVRIKTWPNSPKSGIATDMHFDGVVMDNVGTPILIDQQYCPYGQCQHQIPSRVRIQNVSFKNIRGTSSTQVALKLVCSKGMPCQNVKLSNINLKYTGTNGTSISECSNVKPTIYGLVVPQACARPSSV